MEFLFGSNVIFIDSKVGENLRKNLLSIYNSLFQEEKEEREKEEVKKNKKGGTN